ncbi:MAG: peptidyl-prolyl cis-trans isomerase [Alphaproteobacteria bacterium]
MLQTLRSSVGSIVIKVLFALLVLSFGVWGIGDTFFFGFSDRSAASVGDREISLEEVDTAFRREVARLRPLNIDAQRARQMGVLDQVVTTLVGRALLAEETDRLGLDISDGTIADAIRKDPGFRNELGQFDRNRFAQALAAAGYTEAAYVDGLRRDLTRDQLVLSVTPGRAVPDAPAQALFRWRQERRAADAIRLADDPNQDVGTPDDATVTKVYQEQSAQFTAPEYRAVTYVHLQPGDFAGDVQVPEDRLRETYQSRIEDFTKQERRAVQQLLFPSQQAAAAARQAIDAGKSFADIPAALPDASAQFTDFGTVAAGDLPIQALSDAAFALPEGHVSAPVQSPFGWHLLRVERIEPGEVQSFEAVRDRIVQEMTQELATDALLQAIDKFEDALGGGVTLEEAAASMNFPLRKVAAVDRSGHDADGTAIEGLPAAPFLETVAGAQPGAAGLVTETDLGTYFVLRVDSVTPSALRPLDSVRDRVVKTWAAEQRRKATQQRAEALRDRVSQPDADIAAAASAAGATVEETPAITRDGAGMPDWMPREFASALFGLAKPGDATAVETENGYAVLRLRTVAPADPAADKEAYERFRDQQAQAFAQDMRTQYGLALQKMHGVTINDAAIDRLYDAGSTQ